MGWLEDDEMVKHWEDVRKEEEKITMRKMDGRSLQVEGVKQAPEFPIPQALKQEKEKKKKKKKKKFAYKGRREVVE